MISFDGFLLQDGSPVYMQIIDYIKRGIAAGTIHGGDEIPSRRMLATLLGVNPNTVQKAYHLLEEEGFIESRPGAKSCIVVDEDKMALVRAQFLENDAKTLISAMKAMGVSQDEAISLIKRLWEKEETE